MEKCDIKWVQTLLYIPKYLKTLIIKKIKNGEDPDSIN
jgi:hypothetical protein